MAEAGVLTLAYVSAHPADAARVLETVPPAESAALFASLPARAAAPVLPAMLPPRAARVLGALDDEHALALLSAAGAQGNQQGRQGQQGNQAGQQNGQQGQSGQGQQNGQQGDLQRTGNAGGERRDRAPKRGAPGDYLATWRSRSSSSVLQSMHSVAVGRASRRFKPISMPQLSQ